MADNRGVRREFSETEGKIEGAFSDLAQRSTRPRTIIEEKLKDLARGRKSFTADDLLQEVRGVNPRIGRATVFRSIEQLLSVELLGRIDFPDGRHRYFVCGDQNHHHHLVCTSCHRVTKFKYCLPGDVISEIGKREHFTIEDHTLTLFGLCDGCVSSESARTKLPDSDSKSP